MSKYDKVVCALCESGENEKVLLLCEGCDKPLHTYCIGLPAIPVGKWYCPGCRQKAKPAGKEVAEENQKIRPGLVTFLYERVSSKGQNEPEYGRVGMDTQNNCLLQFALKNGLVVRGTAREVCSARDVNKLLQLLSICKMIKQNQCVVIYSVSRFARNLAQGREMLEKIHEAGGWVYSVTDEVSSNDDKFLKLLELAQQESDQLSRKIRDAHARIRQHGGHIGPAPYGWTTYHDDSGIRKLRIDPDEQKVLARLRELVDKRGEGKTAGILNAEGRLRRGKPWTKGQVLKCAGALTNNTFSKDLRKALDVEPSAPKARDQSPKRPSKK